MAYTFNPFTGTFDYYQAGTTTYPGAGIPVSTGSAWSTSKTTPTGAIVGDTDTQTLSGKTLTTPKIAKIVVPSDSTTAHQVTKADGSTAVTNVDTTNTRVGINTTSPANTLDVNGGALIGGASYDSRYTLSVKPTTSVGMSIIGSSTDYANAIEFGTASTNGSAGGIYWRTTGTPRVNITTFGNASPVEIGNNWVYITGGAGGGAVKFGTYGAGTLVTDASGNITASSDERLKTNIVNYAASLGQILKIQPIQFNWSASTTKLDASQVYTGWSAQNVMKALPEAIGTDPNGYYTVNDRPIIAALVNAVKELVTQINVLRAQAKLEPLDYTVADITNTTKIIKYKSTAQP